MIRSLASVAAALLLAACSGVTWRDSDRGPLAQLETNAAPQRIEVIKLPALVEPAELREVLEPDASDEQPPSDEGRQRFERLETLAGDQIEETLARDGFAVQRHGADPSPTKLRVDYQLRYWITDVGRSPRSWKIAYIGWEITSTIAVAALAYAKPRTRPIAGAYLLEETVEELAEGYAGFWALDRIWSPVRIEAELTDLHTGERIWHGVETGMAESHWSALFQRPRGPDQDAQLESAVRRGSAGLVEQLMPALH